MYPEDIKSAASSGFNSLREHSQDRYLERHSQYRGQFEASLGL